MTLRARLWTVDAAHPMAPSLEIWDAMSREEQQQLVDSLPSSSSSESCRPRAISFDRTHRRALAPAASMGATAGTCTSAQSRRREHVFAPTSWPWSTSRPTRA